MKAEVKIKVKVAQHPHLRFSGRNGTRLQIVKLLYGGLALAMPENRPAHP